VAKITIVGIGPGSPDYVTPVARKTVQNAQVVIGAERALRMFQGEIKGETVVLTAKNVNEVLKCAVESSKKGKAVALLSTGDPGFSGLLGTFLNNITGKSVEVDVVPGISSIQVCAARLHMCWDETILFSFHEGTSLEKKKRLAEAVKEGKDVMLFPDPKSFPPCEVAKFLINNGIDKETPVVVCENLTLNNERAVTSTLEGISKLNFGSLCVMAVRPRRKQKIKRKAKE
jgi:cobalt-precorrin-7 (C5)-methyltransferase